LGLKNICSAEHGDTCLESQLLGRWMKEDLDFMSRLAKIQGDLVSKATYKIKGLGSYLK
jgi:hypothetical protein